MIKQLFFLLFFLFVGVISFAQQPVTIHLTEKDGLPDNEIYSILEDTKGNVWIAANKGLFKYNGKEFTTFSHPKKQGRSFFNLKLDNRGRVWCNNIAGQFFYIENDMLNLFGDYQNLLKGTLSDFEFFKENLVFHLYSKTEQPPTLAFVDFENKTLKVSDFSKMGTSIGSVFNDTYYYISPDYKLYSFNDIEAKAKKISDQVIVKNYWFTSFLRAEKGFFITISDNSHLNTSLYRFDGKLEELTLPKSLADFRIEHVVNFGNTFYLSTSNGAYLADLKGKQLIIRAHYLQGKFVTKTLKDKNGNLWFASRNNGVYVVPNEGLKTITSDFKVTVLEKKNDSTCFVGTENGGFFEYNITSDELFKHPLSSNQTIRDVDYNEDKGMLLFASDTNISLYNTKTKTDNPLKISGSIKSVSIVKSNQFLISASHASILKTNTSDKILNSQRAYVSHYSKNNDMSYVSDGDGVKIYDANFQLIKNLKYNNLPIYAFDITETKDGNLFLATYDNGVIVIENNQVKNILNTANGLASNTTNTIKADENNLWVATESGLQLYDTSNQSFKTITRQDGLDSYNINEIEVLGNTVLFASNLGLFSFDKTKIFRTRKLAKPYISSANINEVDTLIKDKYTLKQTESAIRFQFNTVGFQSNKFTNYQYKLSGLDDNWITVEDGSDYVKFTTLPAGNFQFQLRAKNKFSEDYATAKPIQLLVVLPFYKTWWFWALIFLTALTLIIFYYKNKTKRLKKQQKVELEKAEISRDLVFSQLENLRSQMNPHFIFNALNSIQDYIIGNEKKLARQYLVKFSRLIRTYLEHSQKNEITLAEELDALRLYLQLEKDRFEGGFNYEVVVDNSLNSETILVPSLLIQPYVENALKHGLLHKKTNKNLQVEFKKIEAKEALLCVITDNGIGRKASAVINAKRDSTHKSFATSANQKRIDLLNVSKARKLSVEIIDLEDNNQQSTGTKVVLKIPI